MSENESMTDYLAENPKMIGVLFTIFMLLTQAGNAAGALAATTAGP
jgi:hypothetical protein